jgi:NAD(P)-dependent dehydrogenase (short-subunit alcohol dehydrogenase family)
MRACAVTGGASGIGRATALRLARTGCEVLVLDKNLAGANDVVEVVSAAGGRARAAELDVRDEQALTNALEQLHARAGGLSGLVTSAAVAGPVLGAEANSAEQIVELLTVNAVGTMLAVKHGARLMREAGGGAIVCVASAAALVGSPGRSAYCASKGAVIAFAKTAAVELAQHGVRVNVVCPGIVDTAMVREMWRSEQAEPPGSFDNLLNRMATADEVAAAIAFLLSDEASFIYGTDVVVDGGKVAR